MRDQRVRGGVPLSRGYIYAVLTNPLYRGKIRYKGEIYEGAHEAIIDAETWDRVQAMLIDNARKARGRTRAASPSLLAGLLVTEHGTPFTPSHAVKHGKRYRYYVERPLITGDDEPARDAVPDAGNTSSNHNSSRRRGWRIPAHDIEDAVLGAVAGHLRSHETTRRLLGEDQDAVMRLPELLDKGSALAAMLEAGSSHDRLELALALIAKVTIRDDGLVIALRPNGLRQRVGIQTTANDQDDDPLEIVVPISFRRRGVEMKLVLEDRSTSRTPPRIDPGLVRVIAQAHLWFDRIVSGEVAGPGDIADQDGLARTDVSRALSLAFLAPDIVAAILDGRQPAGLTTTSLLRLAPRLPADWHSQRRVLGFASA